MAITEYASGTRTAGTPPEAGFASLANGSPQDDATDGVFTLYVDLTNMARGDTIEVQCWEKILSSGSQRLIWEATMGNAQDEPAFVSPALVLMHGWEFRLRQTAGTARSFDWSIRQIA